jgi:hypothetical protein
MAEVVASLVEGSPDPKPLQQYIDEGKVTIIESYNELRRRCTELKASVAEIFIEHMMDNKVRAFYCPPLYFVQFTGESWNCD